MNFTIGIDPDSEKHAIAIYQGGKLQSLHEMTLPEMLEQEWMQPGVAKFSIEEVTANNFIYSRNTKQSKAAQSKVGICVGRNQQSQVELVRFLQHRGIDYELHRPQRGNWADPKLKPQFEQVTGWKNNSNKDTRSAAFFGFLGGGINGK